MAGMYPNQYCVSYAPNAQFMRWNGIFHRVPSHGHHAPQFLGVHPSMVGPAGVQHVGNGSSFNPAAQHFHPQRQHSSGNSYNAAHSGPVPQAQVETDAPSRANVFVLDSRHGTLAPKTKRERRKLARKVRKEAEASKAAMASDEAVGDGVNSCPEGVEEEEDDDAGYAGYGIYYEAHESRGLVESHLVRDDEAAASEPAIVEEGLAESPSVREDEAAADKSAIVEDPLAEIHSILQAREAARTTSPFEQYLVESRSVRDDLRQLRGKQPR